MRNDVNGADKKGISEFFCGGTKVERAGICRTEVERGARVVQLGVSFPDSTRLLAECVKCLRESRCLDPSTPTFSTPGSTQSDGADRRVFWVWFRRMAAGRARVGAALRCLAVCLRAVSALLRRACHLPLIHLWNMFFEKKLASSNGGNGGSRGSAVPRPCSVSFITRYSSALGRLKKSARRRSVAHGMSLAKGSEPLSWRQGSGVRTASLGDVRPAAGRPTKRRTVCTKLFWLARSVCAGAARGTRDED